MDSREARDGLELAVLIPVKRFTAAKGRLAPLLDPPTRARLARWLATRVAHAAAPAPTFVACDDEDVAAWAEAAGAEVLWTPGMGLNGAVDESRAIIGGKGFTHLVVVHSDLPLAAPGSLAALVRPGTVTLVPDHRADGTNALAAPVSAPITAAYGAHSFRHHLAQAMASGYGVEVRRDPWLGLDIDTPAELTHPRVAEELPEWLRTSLASRR